MLTSEEVIPSTGDEDDGQLSRRCRFCAEVRPSHDEDEQGDTPEGGWAEVWDDVELQKRVYYYTPIRMLSSSPFPSLLCPRCLRQSIHRNDHSIQSSFKSEAVGGRAGSLVNVT